MVKTLLKINFHANNEKTQDICKKEGPLFSLLTLGGRGKGTFVF
jgi:hypothetical protein